MSIVNLDHVAARYAQAIVAGAADAQNVEALDRVATKSLGVFQEQGIFAGFLFLASRSEATERQLAGIIRGQLLAVLGDELAFLCFQAPADHGVWLALSGELTRQDGLLSNLDTIFLLKSLYEQTLIYTRYGAKAMKARPTGDAHEAPGEATTATQHEQEP